MSPDTANAVATVVGIFVISMLVMSIVHYGWDTIIVMVVGLFVLAAIIRAMGG